MAFFSGPFLPLAPRGGGLFSNSPINGGIFERVVGNNMFLPQWTPQIFQPNYNQPLSGRAPFDDFMFDFDPFLPQPAMPPHPQPLPFPGGPPKPEFGGPPPDMGPGPGQWPAGQPPPDAHFMSLPTVVRQSIVPPLQPMTVKSPFSVQRPKLAPSPSIPLSRPLFTATSNHTDLAALGLAAFPLVGGEFSQYNAIGEIPYFESEPFRGSPGYAVPVPASPPVIPGAVPVPVSMASPSPMPTPGLSPVLHAQDFLLATTTPSPFQTRSATPVWGTPRPSLSPRRSSAGNVSLFSTFNTNPIYGSDGGYGLLYDNPFVYNGFNGIALAPSPMLFY
eukprot:TRINITY_DN16312_c0_g2_i1.p1 TRINITY_DN16312_c0_g2~~TRINITY_DN16312_c0_g2_i1.p1  ORF type:complete len:333 (-),score=19.00 TRINITY_DN16312_c0_g2_i1:222-1220(-)